MAAATAGKAEKNARAHPHLIAAQVVMQVVDFRKSLPTALAAGETRLATDSAATGWLREVAYGGCRYYYHFDAVLARLLAKPLKTRDRILHFILINACYQLTHMRTPDYAVVNESVAAVAASRWDWGAKLLNGVLRGFLKSAQQPAQTVAAEFAFPAWLCAAIQQDWGEYAAQIFAASNRHPPLTLRVNLPKISRAAYLKRLQAEGIAAAPTQDSTRGVILETPVAVAQIPGFGEGLVSVQDESAQLVTEAWSPPAGKVLDGCAAPGGKTGLLLESGVRPTALVAVDLPPRTELIHANLERLGVSEVRVVAAELCEFARAGDNAGEFAAVLLDVPCSGSGVISRHPDIKHRRAPSDIAQFAETQFNLLVDAWRVLGHGGQLVYVTCSILGAENDAVIARFLQTQPEAEVAPLALPSVPTRFGRQRLPGVHSGDGFYYCQLNKPQ